MGKSRLMEAFRRRLRRHAYHDVQGQCLSYGQTMPYLPIIDLLRYACGISASDRPAERMAKVVRGLQRIGMDGVDETPYLLHLLGDHIEAKWLDEQHLKARTFDLLFQMSVNASHQRPLLIEIEDIHWIDSTSETWLAALAERLANLPIMLVATYRPGYRPPWIERSYATQIALTRLSPHDSRTLLAALVDTRSIDDALIQTWVAKADGNPFFLEELARDTKAHSRSSMTLAAVPDTIQAVLMARIDDLPPTAKQVLQIAATIGSEQPLSLLEALVDLPDKDLQQSLCHLQAVELIQEIQRVPQPVYTFKHVLTRETVYASLLTRTRQRTISRSPRCRYAICRYGCGQPERLAFHYAQANRANARYSGVTAQPGPPALGLRER